MTSSSVVPSPFVAALVRRAESAPGDVVLICGERSLTMFELVEASERLAGALLARGVWAGDRVALHMRNLPEAVIGYLGCLRMGAIAVPLNARFKADELRDLITRTRPVLYLGEAMLHARLASLPEELLALRSRFVVGAPDGLGGARPWSELMETPAAEAHSMGAGPDDIAVLLATSGTSGPSKLAGLTHRMLASFALSAGARGIGEATVMPVATPLMHGSGVYWMTTLLSLGGTAVLVPTFDPDLVLDAIERHRCTAFFGLPFMCGQVAERQAWRPRDVSSLRMCTVAGDVCPPGIETAFRAQMHRALMTFWASTEDGGALSPGSRVGPFVRATPGTEVRIVDEGGRAVARGEVGELLVRSATTVAGYWRGPGRVEPFADGFFHSGDLVRALEDGSLEMVGRIKDLIIRGGSNISPGEVEAVLCRHRAVREAVVAGIADPELGQRVGAVLVLGDGEDGGVVREILAWVREKIADYKVPELVVVVARLPRNMLTKVDRAVAAEMIEGGVRDGSTFVHDVGHAGSVAAAQAAAQESYRDWW